MSALRIDFVPGSVAPTYKDAKGLICELLTSGPDGILRVLTLTGRLVNSVSAAVRGVNVRNHGVEEP